MKANFITVVFVLCYGITCSSQTKSFDQSDKELAEIYSRIFPFYYSDKDSLDFYSERFSDKFIHFIRNNPSTINCKFKILTNSNACHIVTSDDGNFRIYSWDTWQGGTMHIFKNVYQFRSGNKIS